jgi:hypothetical protein
MVCGGRDGVRAWGTFHGSAATPGVSQTQTLYRFVGAAETQDLVCGEDSREEDAAVRGVDERRDRLAAPHGGTAQHRRRHPAHRAAGRGFERSVGHHARVHGCLSSLAARGPRPSGPVLLHPAVEPSRHPKLHPTRAKSEAEGRPEQSETGEWELGGICAYGVGGLITGG